MMLRSREENALAGQVDSATKKRLPNIYGIQRSGVFTDHAKTGKLRQTNDPHHLALAPELKNSFFAVQRTNSSDQSQHYTRNGTLSFNRLNPADPASPTVLHISSHIALDANKQPIQVDPGKGPITVASHGEIRQNGSVIGEIPVFRLNKNADPTNQVSADLQKLTKLGDSLYRIPDQRKNEFHPLKLEVGQPGIHRLMSQGTLEGSNVNIINEMVEMMNATKGATANQTAISKQLDGLNKLFQLVRR